VSRYLISGGAGFIGSHLCERLLAAGHTVRVIDDLSTGKRENLPDGVELRVGDAADRTFVEEATLGADGIFHLAAIASVERSREDWLGGHRANQTAALVALDVARARARLPVVLASSAAVYGDSDQLPLRETALPRPVNAYGADKAGAELHARVAWQSHRVPTASLRIFNVFGPRQDANSSYSGVITIFAELMKRGESPIIYGDGQQTRDFIYVSDVARHLEAAMASIEANPRSVLCNVCTGRAVTVEALGQRIAELLGRDGLKAQFAEPRPGDVRYSRGDPSLAVQELRVRAETTLDGGLLSLLREDGSDACGASPLGTAPGIASR
jgi:UDP-glucose 4-epimerase